MNSSTSTPQILCNQQNIYHHNNINNVWVPPKQHGLQNSKQIIHPWFIRNSQLNGEPIDYVAILKDDIRNFRPLDNTQLEYIKNLDKDDLFEIIKIYNDATRLLIQ